MYFCPSWNLKTDKGTPPWLLVLCKHAWSARLLRSAVRSTCSGGSGGSRPRGKAAFSLRLSNPRLYDSPEMCIMTHEWLLVPIRKVMDAAACMRCWEDRGRAGEVGIGRDEESVNVCVCARACVCVPVCVGGWYKVSVALFIGATWLYFQIEYSPPSPQL